MSSRILTYAVGVNANRVLRDGYLSSISAADVVPGDVVELAAGPVFCDMVLLSECSVTVDESALTGEKTPVSKESIKEEQSATKYNPKDHASATIWAGTELIEVDGLCRALVLATGSFTAKGELLANVFYNHQRKHMFESDAKVVLGFLIVETCVLSTLVFVWLGFAWVDTYFYRKCNENTIDQTLPDSYI
jgi:P-type Ca2+ transporter type 2C